MARQQGVLTSHISSALRRLLGMRTLVDASVGSGMMAEVVGANSSHARFLFCVTGPQAVDLATLWYSPDGAALCSCWGHSENVALLSMAGEDSTCWHAMAFKAAVKGLAGHEPEISEYLRVAGDAPPYAVDISTFRGPAAAAFDGTIYSPVVATRRRDIKCVAVGCRSSQRRCLHAVLTRELERLSLPGEEDEDLSEITSEEEGTPVDHNEDEDVGMDEDDLVAISKDRQRRNLVSCAMEDKQGLMWARTAEWAAVDVPANAIFSPSPSAEDGQTEPPAKPPTLLGRMAELGLAYDPSVVLHEGSCSKCGAKKPAGIELEKMPALLYCDGNAVEPLNVRSGHSLSATALPVVCLVLVAPSLLYAVHELTPDGTPLFPLPAMCFSLDVSASL